MNLVNVYQSYAIVACAFPFTSFDEQDPTFPEEEFPIATALSPACIIRN